jgi:hypothetical protein
MSTDPKRLADFWTAALGLTERRDEATETIAADANWTYPRLTFQKVDEARPAQRLHLDLTASEDRLFEVSRLRQLGAQEVRTVSVGDNWCWTVMTDPDGNEFCLTDP